MDNSNQHPLVIYLLSIANDLVPGEWIHTFGSGDYTPGPLHCFNLSTDDYWGCFLCDKEFKFIYDNDLDVHAINIYDDASIRNIIKRIITSEDDLEEQE